MIKLFTGYETLHAEKKVGKTCLFFSGNIATFSGSKILWLNSAVN
jgi:hypothetical protein